MLTPPPLAPCTHQVPQPVQPQDVSTENESIPSRRLSTGNILQKSNSQDSLLNPAPKLSQRKVKPEDQSQRSPSSASSTPPHPLPFQFNSRTLQLQIQELVNIKPENLRKKDHLIVKQLLIALLSEDDYSDLRKKTLVAMGSKEKSTLTNLLESTLKQVLKETNEDKRRNVVIENLDCLFYTTDAQISQSYKHLGDLLKALLATSENTDIHEPAGYNQPTLTFSQETLAKDQVLYPVTAFVSEQEKPVALDPKDLDDLSRCSFLAAPRKDVAVFDDERWSQLSSTEQKEIGDDAVVGDKSFVNDCLRYDARFYTEVSSQLPLVCLFSAREHEKILKSGKDGETLDDASLKIQCAQYAMHTLEHLLELDEQARFLIRNLMNQGAINELFTCFFKKILPRHGIYCDPTQSTNQQKGLGLKIGQMELNVWKNGCLEICLEGAFEAVVVGDKKLDGNDIRLSLRMLAGKKGNEWRITSANTGVTLKSPKGINEAMHKRPAIWFDIEQPANKAGKRWQEVLKKTSLGLTEKLPNHLSRFPETENEGTKMATAHIAVSGQQHYLTNISALGVQDKALARAKEEFFSPRRPSKRLSQRISQEARQKQSLRKKISSTSRELLQARFPLPSKKKPSIEELFPQMLKLLHSNSFTDYPSIHEGIKILCGSAAIDDPIQLTAICEMFDLIYKPLGAVGITRLRTELRANDSKAETDARKQDLKHLQTSRRNPESAEQDFPSPSTS